MLLLTDFLAAFVSFMMSSASIVAAALSSVAAADGEPAVKKAHTNMEDVTKSMSPDNQALFAAIQAMVETKMEKRFDHVDRAMSAMAEATDKGLQEVKKELDKVKGDVKVIQEKAPKPGSAGSAFQRPEHDPSEPRPRLCQLRCSSRASTTSRRRKEP